WSLMKANAVSWALLQLLIGLGVFGISIARRFGPVRPVPSDELPKPSFIGGIARLLRMQKINYYAAGRELSHFLPAAMRRFGLPADTPPATLVETLKSIRPDLGEKLEGALNGLQGFRDGRFDQDDTKLLRYLQALALIRKELRIHG
ncbi:MAG TPA: hypothetical protein PKM25_04900, partial [Candidatus Ozemobacteraceae bacterium]|nr:hypothetical protein [Candidatus Ozemobacteraceae bacterium]